MRDIHRCPSVSGERLVFKRDRCTGNFRARKKSRNPSLSKDVKDRAAFKLFKEIGEVLCYIFEKVPMTVVEMRRLFFIYKINRHRVIKI